MRGLMTYIVHLGHKHLNIIVFFQNKTYLLTYKREIKGLELSSPIFYLGHILCPWLDFGLPPQFPQVLWCYWGEIEPLSATLTQDGLAECDQPGKNPLKYPTTEIEPRPQGGQTVGYICTLTELSCLNPSPLMGVK